MPHVALVTGGGRGIGRAIVLALARRGVAVAVAARTRAEVDRTADEARALGARVGSFELDVTAAERIDRVVSEAAASLGPIDVLVNNAGLAESAPFAKTDVSCPRASVSNETAGAVCHRL